MMRDSLFVSAAFISVEIGFVAVSLFAVYELLIGDFIWTNNEKQRTSAHSQRGNAVSYDPLYNTSRREYYDKSLSATKDSRNGPTRHTSSPDETYDRRTNPLRGSTGDNTRRMFYKLILMTLLCRLICFPIETHIFSSAINIKLDPTTKYKIKRLRWVLLRATQTLPYMTMASAFGLLIVFCVQVALQLSPQPTTTGIDETVEVVGVSPQPTREDDFNKLSIVTNGDTDELEQNLTQSIVGVCSKCARKTLASRMTFFMWNLTLLVSFLATFLVALVIPSQPFEICLWFALISVYSALSLVLIYTGSVLLKALQPGVLHRKGANSLALRLISMCILVWCVFLDHLISFGISAQKASDSSRIDKVGVVSQTEYRANAISYTLFELLPVLLILLIMHRKKKESAPNGQNDVLITNSAREIYGKNARPGNGDSAPSSKVGLGSRKFQTYHGSRSESFPLKSSKHGGSAHKMNSPSRLSKETSPLLPK